MGMGERKLRAKQFTQKTDEVVDEEVKAANLFSNTLVESELTYECEREPEDAPVAVGNAVRLVDMRQRIDVFIGLTSVGYVAANQVDTLRSTLRIADRKGRSLRGHVIEVSEITPTFTVSIGK
jgi:hypothetical protein